MRVSASSRSPRQASWARRSRRRSSKASVCVLLVVLAGAAQQRAHAREQLAQRERLDEVVVGAGVQAGHAVVDLARARSASAPACGRRRRAGAGRPRGRRRAASRRRGSPTSYGVALEALERLAARRPPARPRSARAQARATARSGRRARRRRPVCALARPCVGAVHRREPYRSLPAGGEDASSG